MTDYAFPKPISLEPLVKLVGVSEVRTRVAALPGAVAIACKAHQSWHSV